MRLALSRRKPPTLMERLDAIALNVLAVAWAARLVWYLRRGRLPPRRRRRR
jgi:hypothetical protein